jgi:hypothetical protein
MSQGGAWVDRAKIPAGGRVSPASDAEPIRTVKRWKYQAARVSGEPVAVRKGVCVAFRTGGADALVE